MTDPLGVWPLTPSAATVRVKLGQQRGDRLITRLDVLLQGGKALVLPMAINGAATFSSPRSCPSGCRPDAHHTAVGHGAMAAIEWIATLALIALLPLVAHSLLP